MSTGHSGMVLASTQGDVQFIEVSDGPEFRTDLQQALRDGLTALGLLGWEFRDGTLQTNPRSARSVSRCRPSASP